MTDQQRRSAVRHPGQEDRGAWEANQRECDQGKSCALTSPISACMNASSSANAPIAAQGLVDGGKRAPADLIVPTGAVSCAAASIAPWPEPPRSARARQQWLHGVRLENADRL
jgi:hypothetical protein